MPLGTPRRLGTVAVFSAARGRVWPRAGEERPRPPRRTTRGVRAASTTPRSRPAPLRSALARWPSKSGGKAVANTKGAARRAPRRAAAPLPPSQGRPGHYITSAAPDAGRRAPAEHKNGGPAAAAPTTTAPQKEAAPIDAAGDGRGRPDPVRRRAGPVAARRYGSVRHARRDTTGSQDRTGCARSGPGLRVRICRVCRVRGF